ncbi:conserved Plasmodium membrane protein, unknown function [Plasmodium sp. DRC-Itaito]|nr:conserved Plasmodium membrane protein, unknown function [Plasmodium sp. DRC-Itaito]
MDNLEELIEEYICPEKVMFTYEKEKKIELIYEKNKDKEENKIRDNILQKLLLLIKKEDYEDYEEGNTKEVYKEYEKKSHGKRYENNVRSSNNFVSKDILDMCLYKIKKWPNNNLIKIIRILKKYYFCNENMKRGTSINLVTQLLERIDICDMPLDYFETFVYFFIKKIEDWHCINGVVNFFFLMFEKYEHVLKSIYYNNEITELYKNLFIYKNKTKKDNNKKNNNNLYINNDVSMKDNNYNNDDHDVFRSKNNLNDEEENQKIDALMEKDILYEQCSDPYSNYEDDKCLSSFDEYESDYDDNFDADPSDYNSSDEEDYIQIRRINKEQDEEIKLCVVYNILKKLFKHIHAPSYLQGIRLNYYKIILKSLENFRNEIISVPNFIDKIQVQLENESDPRNILVLFDIIYILCNRYISPLETNEDFISINEDHLYEQRDDETIKVVENEDDNNNKNYNDDDNNKNYNDDDNNKNYNDDDNNKNYNDDDNNKNYNDDDNNKNYNDDDNNKNDDDDDNNNNNNNKDDNKNDHSDNHSDVVHNNNNDEKEKDKKKRYINKESLFTYDKETNYLKSLIDISFYYFPIEFINNDGRYDSITEEILEESFFRCLLSNKRLGAYVIMNILDQFYNSDNDEISEKNLKSILRALEICIPYYGCECASKFITTVIGLIDLECIENNSTDKMIDYFIDILLVFINILNKESISIKYNIFNRYISIMFKKIQKYVILHKSTYENRTYNINEIVEILRGNNKIYEIYKIYKNGGDNNKIYKNDGDNNKIYKNDGDNNKIYTYDHNNNKIPTNCETQTVVEDIKETCGIINSYDYSSHNSSDDDENNNNYLINTIEENKNNMYGSDESDKNIFSIIKEKNVIDEIKEKKEKEKKKNKIKIDKFNVLQKILISISKENHYIFLYIIYTIIKPILKECYYLICFLASQKEVLKKYTNKINHNNNNNNNNSCCSEDKKFFSCNEKEEESKYNIRIKKLFNILTSYINFVNNILENSVKIYKVIKYNIYFLNDIYIVGEIIKIGGDLFIHRYHECGLELFNILINLICIHNNDNILKNELNCDDNNLSIYLINTIISFFSIVGFNNELIEISEYKKKEIFLYYKCYDKLYNLNIDNNSFDYRYIWREHIIKNCFSFMEDIKKHNEENILNENSEFKKNTLLFFLSLINKIIKYKYVHIKNYINTMLINMSLLILKIYICKEEHMDRYIKLLKKMCQMEDITYIIFVITNISSFILNYFYKDVQRFKDHYVCIKSDNIYKDNPHGDNIYKDNLHGDNIYKDNLHGDNIYKDNLHGDNIYCDDTYKCSDNINVIEKEEPPPHSNLFQYIYDKQNYNYCLDKNILKVVYTLKVTNLLFEKGKNIENEENNINKNNNELMNDNNICVYENINNLQLVDNNIIKIIVNLNIDDNEIIYYHFNFLLRLTYLHIYYIYVNITNILFLENHNKDKRILSLQNINNKDACKNKREMLYEIFICINSMEIMDLCIKYMYEESVLNKFLFLKEIDNHKKKKDMIENNKKSVMVEMDYMKIMDDDKQNILYYRQYLNNIKGFININDINNLELISFDDTEEIISEGKKNILEIDENIDKDNNSLNIINNNLFKYNIMKMPNKIFNFKILINTQELLYILKIILSIHIVYNKIKNEYNIITNNNKEERLLFSFCQYIYYKWKGIMNYLFIYFDRINNRKEFLENLIDHCLNKVDEYVINQDHIEDDIYCVTFKNIYNLKDNNNNNNNNSNNIMINKTYGDHPIYLYKSLNVLLIFFIPSLLGLDNNISEQHIYDLLHLSMYVYMLYIYNVTTNFKSIKGTDVLQEGSNENVEEDGCDHTTITHGNDNNNNNNNNNDGADNYYSDSDSSDDNIKREHTNIFKKSFFFKKKKNKINNNIIMNDDVLNSYDTFINFFNEKSRTILYCDENEVVDKKDVVDSNNVVDKKDVVDKNYVDDNNMVDSNNVDDNNMIDSNNVDDNNMVDSNKVDDNNNIVYRNNNVNKIKYDEIISALDFIDLDLYENIYECALQIISIIIYNKLDKREKLNYIYMHMNIIKYFTITLKDTILFKILIDHFTNIFQALMNNNLKKKKNIYIHEKIYCLSIDTFFNFISNTFNVPFYEDKKNESKMMSSCDYDVMNIYVQMVFFLFDYLYFKKEIIHNKRKYDLYLIHDNYDKGDYNKKGCYNINVHILDNIHTNKIIDDTTEDCNKKININWKYLKKINISIYNSVIIRLINVESLLDIHKEKVSTCCHEESCNFYFMCHFFMSIFQMFSIFYDLSFYVNKKEEELKKKSGTHGMSHNIYEEENMESIYIHMNNKRDKQLLIIFYYTYISHIYSYLFPNVYNIDTNTLFCINNFNSIYFKEHHNFLNTYKTFLLLFLYHMFNYLYFIDISNKFITITEYFYLINKYNICFESSLSYDLIRNKKEVVEFVEKNVENMSGGLIKKNYNNIDKDENNIMRKKNKLVMSTNEYNMDRYKNDIINSIYEVNTIKDKSHIIYKIKCERKQQKKKNNKLNCKYLTIIHLMSIVLLNMSIQEIVDNNFYAILEICILKGINKVANFFINKKEYLTNNKKYIMKVLKHNSDIVKHIFTRDHKKNKKIKIKQKNIKNELLIEKNLENTTNECIIQNMMYDKNIPPYSEYKKLIMRKIISLNLILCLRLLYLIINTLNYFLKYDNKIINHKEENEQNINMIKKKKFIFFLLSYKSILMKNVMKILVSVPLALIRYLSVCILYIISFFNYDAFLSYETIQDIKWYLSIASIDPHKKVRKMVVLCRTRWM